MLWLTGDGFITYYYCCFFNGIAFSVSAAIALCQRVKERLAYIAINVDEVLPRFAYRIAQSLAERTFRRSNGTVSPVGICSRQTHL